MHEFSLDFPGKTVLLTLEFSLDFPVKSFLLTLELSKSNVSLDLPVTNFS